MTSDLENAGSEPEPQPHERHAPRVEPRPLQGRTEPREAADEVDESSRDSFPASDPPSWTTTQAGPPSRQITDDVALTGPRPSDRR